MIPIAKRKLLFVRFCKSKSVFKVMGIIFALGYLITFLGVWVYQTEFQPHTYIVVGEPNLIIKYFEWMLGIIAIGYLFIEGKKTLDDGGMVSYDPLV